MVGVSELGNAGPKNGYIKTEQIIRNCICSTLNASDDGSYATIDATVILGVVHHCRIITATFRRLNLLPSSGLTGKRENLLWLIPKEELLSMPFPLQTGADPSSEKLWVFLSPTRLIVSKISATIMTLFVGCRFEILGSDWGAGLTPERGHNWTDGDIVDRRIECDGWREFRLEARL